jgi:hypothetical protein
MRGQMETQQRQHQEPVEVLRAALCALTYRTAEQFEPVHVMRIRGCCERLGLLEDVVPLLAILRLLREAEDLGDGYWGPTAPRVVKLPGCQLLLSPNPTPELHRWYGTVIKLAGFGRTADAGANLGLPAQTVDDWIGSPSNLALWTRDILKHAENNLRSTVHPDGPIEVYAPWRQLAGTDEPVRKRWFGLQDLMPDDGNELLLCRVPRIEGRRWFFAKLFEQGVGRVYREGQKRRVHVRIAIAENTVQVRMHNLMLAADELVHAVMGGWQDLRAALYGG